MKRSEFVPGVLFHMPGSNGHQVFRLHQHAHDNGFLIIRRHGSIHGGRLILTEDYESWHFDQTKQGIRLWTVADSVYLQSKVIPFSALRLAEIPEPATNPVS